MSEEGRSETGRVRLVGRGVALVAGVAVGLFLIFGWSPEPDGVEVRGRALGAVREVLLVEPNRGVEVVAAIDEQGNYRLRAPARAAEPVLELYAAQGTGVVLSPPIDLSRGREWVEMLPLAVWSPRLEIRLREERLRFRWAPIPTGQEGFPSAVLYSLLIAYTKADGTPTESVLPCVRPELEITLTELFNEQTLPEYDPGHGEVELHLRAIDPTFKIGPQWIGARQMWMPGTEQTRPVPPRER